jgi:hypothetical protein
MHEGIATMAHVKARDEKPRPQRTPSANETPPPAGPHAKPELTDKDKTPKSGVLPEADETQTEAPTG